MNPRSTELAELREKCYSLQNTIDNNLDTVAYFKQRSHAQTALNEIISISLQSIPFGEMLKEILQVVLDVSCIPLEKKVAYFLSTKNGTALNRRFPITCISPRSKHVTKRRADAVLVVAAYRFN